MWKIYNPKCMKISKKATKKDKLIEKALQPQLVILTLLS